MEKFTLTEDLLNKFSVESIKELDKEHVYLIALNDEHYTLGQLRHVASDLCNILHDKGIECVVVEDSVISRIAELSRSK